MIFSLELIIKSIASQLAGEFNIPVYASATQQGAEYPCFFIFLMTGRIRDQIDRACLRDIGIDVVYVQERNAVNADLELLQIGDRLDQLLDMISYTDGTDTVPLHTHDREQSIEDQELHYKLYIRQRVSIPELFPLMMTEETDVKIKD